jgi:hypothetical protein
MTEGVRTKAVRIHTQPLSTKDRKSWQNHLINAIPRSGLAKGSYDVGSRSGYAGPGNFASPEKTFWNYIPEYDVK